MGKKAQHEKNHSTDSIDQVTSFFEIPKETIIDVPLIHLVGTKDLTVENFIGILEYGDNTIRLNTKDGVLCIQGTNLQARSMTSEVIKIKGNIESISFNN